MKFTRIVYKILKFKRFVLRIQESNADNPGFSENYTNITEIHCGRLPKAVFFKILLNVDTLRTKQMGKFWMKNSGLYLCIISEHFERAL